MGPDLKKTAHASEQERPDVQAERLAWKAAQGELDPARLVFLDETGLSTKMARAHGRSPRGERCVAAIPHGHWKTTTFIAGLRHGAVTAPMVLDGPMNGEAFLLYVRRMLCDALGPGDLVIADNLSSHKVCGVREAIEAVGASFINLPAYSPDLNPIEMFFSKLKAHLRKAACRNVQDLWEGIALILNGISPTECANYFTAAGYVNN